ncbi:MAG: hypothetical protein P8J52_02945 [Gammaproteobacteria bacterium]|nr:hypothetical protein [Gammaproteobacteria bacterium]
MFAALIDLTSVLFISLPIGCAFIASKGSKYGFVIARSIIVQVGVIAALIGAIFMLGSLSDPDALYPATSILLLAFVYAFIFRGVAGLVVNNCEIDLPLEFEFKFLAAACFIFLLSLSWVTSVIGDFFAFMDFGSALFLLASISCILFIGVVSDAENILKLVADSLPFAGLIGFLIGFVLCLALADDPAAIGPALAFGFISLLYTNCISVFIKLAKPCVNHNSEVIGWHYGVFVLIGIGSCWALLISLV